MARPKTVHRCSECGATTARWTGRCPSCGGWNCLIEERATSPRATGGAAAGPPGAAGDPPVPLAQVDRTGRPTVSTTLGELDRVLGGGLVPGSATLVGGEPGIGKSTLLLQAAAGMAAAGRRCLLISAEESRAQVRLRAERLGPVADLLWVGSTTSLAEAVAAISELEPALCVVDSIQTLYDDGLESAPGSVAQVRDCAHRLVGVAKESDMALVLVGHVTKEGVLAGPRVLEHLVDTVLSFEGDRHHSLRLLRAVKHRFGPTGELGLFEMTGTGLAPVEDASSALLEDRRPGVAGSLVVPAMEGGRSVLVELQALVVGGEFANPRRSAQGLDPGRLAIVLAVLDKRVGVKLGGCDVYASVVGGVRVAEPAADLAMALALISTQLGPPLPADMVAFGEVGLGGEVRQVVHTPKRLSEAARLGFRRALVPRSSPDGPPGMDLIRVTTVREAAEVTGLV